MINLSFELLVLFEEFLGFVGERFGGFSGGDLVEMVFVLESFEFGFEGDVEFSGFDELGGELFVAGGVGEGECGEMGEFGFEL